MIRWFWFRRAESEIEVYMALLQQPDPPGLPPRTHGPFLTADRWASLEERRLCIFQPIQQRWAQYRHLAVDQMFMEQR